MGVPYAEVIGDPVAHSKSPTIHKYWLEKLGIEGDYRATKVTADELPDYLGNRRADPDWRGCNVTMPHKQRVIQYLDTTTRNAAAIGAVNTIRRDEEGRLHGRNTDVHGVARCLDGFAQDGLTAVLIGAGGSARAAAHVLRGYSASDITVVNRTVERAERLLADLKLGGRATSSTLLPPADLVINTVPAREPPDLSGLEAHAVVLDLIYTPPETRLLREASDMGLRTVDGITMLIHQAAEAFAAFFSAASPRDTHGDLRRLLTS